LFPIALACVVLAQDGLTVWLGSDLAANSTRVLQWLAVGVFLNSLAQVPFALLQAAGRPNVTAALHLVELPLYLVGVVWLLQAYGVDGAAIAWTARVGVDAVCLFGLALWCLPASARVVRRVALVATAALAALALAAWQPGLPARAAGAPPALAP